MIHNSGLQVLYRNYDHVAQLWQQEQWVPESAVAQARAQYAAYSVQRTDGLRIITLNADFCKRLFAGLCRSDMMYTTQGIRVHFLIQKVLGCSKKSAVPICLTTSITRNLTFLGCCDF